MTVAEFRFSQESTLQGCFVCCMAYFVSKFTHVKLKEGESESVILPINESAVMKAYFAEWISKSVTVINEKKQEKGCVA